jgi:hypothetical protein
VRKKVLAWTCSAPPTVEFCDDNFRAGTFRRQISLSFHQLSRHLFFYMIPPGMNSCRTRIKRHIQGPKIFCTIRDLLRRKAYTRGEHCTEKYRTSDYRKNRTGKAVLRLGAYAYSSLPRWLRLFSNPAVMLEVDKNVDLLPLQRVRY